MIRPEKHCRAILTDSGGVRTEAYFFEKLCIPLRDETEWVELVESGVSILARPDRNIIMAFEEMCSARTDFSIRHYGCGTAGRRILEALFGNPINSTI